MHFGDDFNSILPTYLVSTEKDRLKKALAQFKSTEAGVIDYSNFYKNYPHQFFLQSDLVREIRVAHWNDEICQFEKMYSDAIIISNTCDLSADNSRSLNSKRSLLAPIIQLDEYTNDLKSSGIEEKTIASFLDSIKKQLITNIFYLPHLQGIQIEYIALLDNVFWFPTEELNSYTSNISETKIASLDLFGHYLFILKLSFHLCRLPEEPERNS